MCNHAIELVISLSTIENWVYEVYLCYVQDKFASKNGRDKFSGIAGGIASETTSQRWGSEKKKQQRRVDGSIPGGCWKSSAPLSDPVSELKYL